MKELREKLNEYSKSKGWGEDDSTIREILTESKTLKEYAKNEHRWYTTFRCVVQVEDIFIDFQTYTNSGDEPAMDHKDWDNMVLSSMKQVLPKEKIIIDYE